MALSKETVTVFFSSVLNSSSGLQTLCLTVIPENRIKSFLSKTESAVRKAVKGVRLDLSDFKKLDYRTEKSARDLISALASEPGLSVVAVRFYPGNSAKNQFMMNLAFSAMVQLLHKNQGIFCFDPSSIRASAVNTALKKTGVSIRMEKRDTAGSLLMEASRFLADILSAEPESDEMKRVQSWLENECSRTESTGLQLLEGEPKYYAQSLDQKTADSLFQLLRQYPILHRDHLCDYLVRKNITENQVQSLADLLDSGFAPDKVREVFPSRLEEALEQQKQENSLAQTAFPEFRNQLNPEKIRSDFQRMAREMYQGDEKAEEQLSEQIQKGIDQTAASVVQNRFLSGHPERVHAYIGCCRVKDDSGTYRECCTALIPFHEEIVRKTVKQAGDLEMKSDFAGQIQKIQQNGEFEDWLNDYFQVLVPENIQDFYLDQLENLLIRIAEISPKTMLHMSELTGPDLKALLIARNWYFPYAAQTEKEEPLLRAARMAAVLLMESLQEKAEDSEIQKKKSVEPAAPKTETDLPPDETLITGVPEDHEIFEEDIQSSQLESGKFCRFIADQKIYDLLDPEQKRILSSPWLNTALTKRMAEAFSRGLKADQVLFVLWTEKKEQRDRKLRALLLEWLYPARIRAWLKEQLQIRTVDEYDFISSPDCSLSRMKAAADCLDAGWTLPELRKAITYSSTLRTIEKALENVPQNRPEPDVRTVNVPVFTKDAEMGILYEFAERLFVCMDENGEPEKQALKEKIMDLIKRNRLSLMESIILTDG